MPPNLTAAQESVVRTNSKSSKPSVYNPGGTTATAISSNFEAWLILTSKGVKSKLLGWLKTILDSEADKDYEDLLLETMTAEQLNLSTLSGNVATQTSSFDTWRADPGISGWQDVAEIGWLMQEVQQGFSPYQEQDELKHAEALRAAVGTRGASSKDSKASRKTRLNAWIAALNAYP